MAQFWANNVLPAYHYAACQELAAHELQHALRLRGGMLAVDFLREDAEASGREVHPSNRR